jgi:hypothetical protein
MAQPQQVMVTVPGVDGTTTQLPTAETSLANAAYQDANDYVQFLAQYNDPQYTSPAAYTSNMIAYAQSLCYGSWAPYTCIGFDPVAKGTQYANAVFAALKAVILPSTGKSVYDTWIANPPKQYSDYTPPATQQPYNPANVPGSSTLPVSNTLNNVAPTPVSVTPLPATSVLNPPVQNWFPLNPDQIANGTTGESLLPDMSGATSWLQSNWMLVAGAVAAVVILPSLLGGRR